MVVVDPWGLLPRGLNVEHLLVGEEYVSEDGEVAYCMQLCEEVLRESEDPWGLACTIPDDAVEVDPASLPELFRAQFREVVKAWRAENALYVLEDYYGDYFLHSFRRLK